MNPDSLITSHFRLTLDQKKALDRLHINTLEDLLLHLPSRYAHQGEAKRITDLTPGETATIYGKVIKTKISKGWKTKIPMSEAVIEDGSGKIKAIWFHQAYMAAKVPEGSLVQFSGKVMERNGEKYLANPDIGGKEMELSDSLFAGAGDLDRIQAVYPESRGISSGWIYYHIQTLLSAKVHEKITDPIPPTILKKYHLPTLPTALVWIHSPQKGSDAEAARKRFAFQEIFLIQLDRIDKRLRYQHNSSFNVQTKPDDIANFIKRFPFAITKAQQKAIIDITNDFTKGKPMTRLLEGDVGSGKTAVAAATAFACVRAGFEVAYMVPTEILARQHFESFIKYFAHLNVAVGLLTGTECRKFPSKINPHEHTHISRPQLLKWVANGDIPIVIGTHALIQKAVQFKKLAFVIIDEQHRFGVMQRSKLLKQGSGDEAPHLLSMTATPIPRTLALTLYGDLDLTLLDELPAGRKPIITTIIRKDERAKAYEAIRKELQTGRQAYVICPRIDEPDPDKAFAVQAKSAKAESVRLKKNIFPEYNIGLLHSKLNPRNKEEVMQEFTAGDIQILVATSVVEVGVNVPNATVIIIEGPERFGLAQLHQLRGRVMRSSDQAYCYLLTETTNEKSLQRLKKLVTAKNGFELAEADLELRGSGTLSGEKQWGLSDLAMDAIKNLKLVEAARTEAEKLLIADPDLTGYPKLKEIITSKTSDIHLE